MAKIKKKSTGQIKRRSRNQSNAQKQSDFNPRFRLGVLGGGQLAQMMALAAYPLGVTPLIYSSSPDEPASPLSAWRLPQGPSSVKSSEAMGDLRALEDFIRQCDAVTFESEFMDALILEDISFKTKVPIYPSPRLMGQLQDRATQKSLLTQYQIPSAPYMEIKNWSDIVLFAAQTKSKQIVLKQRRFGYDGYGTYFLDISDDECQWDQIVQKVKVGFIAEKKIRFQRELALLLARDQTGHIIDFPLVESRQTQARCDWVVGPVQHPKEKKLRRQLKEFLRSENYVGVIAFELFDTGPELLVNEIAPRVHNSGHYSQNALTLSQFQAHVMSVCGLQLPIPQLISPFAMANLLGTSDQLVSWSPDTFKYSPFCFLHWYQKKDNRPHRKMGHINAIGPTSKQALKRALTARRKVNL